MIFCIVPIKELKKDYLPFITTALSLVLLAVALKRGAPLFEYMKNLGVSNSEEYFNVLFKCFGIVIITGLVSQMCSDFGVQGVAEKVEFVGKIAVLMTILPLVDTLLSLVETLL